jgi:hypothetical protein
MWLHFGVPNYIRYILIIKNDCADNKSNTLHYLATIFDSSAILNHINACKCWFQTLFSQTLCAHICMLNFEDINGF